MPRLTYRRNREREPQPYDWLLVVGAGLVVAVLIYLLTHTT